MKRESPSPSPARRDLLKIAAAAAVAGPAWTAEPETPQPDGPARSALIDTNVHLFRWPLRRLPGDDTGALAAKLRGQGVTQAWAGSFEGLLHRDLAGVNARLAAECRGRGQGLFLPFGSVNPKLPDWEDDLRRCAEEHRMPGIRLHPAYHGYLLDDPDFANCLRLAAARKLIVQVAITMEDRRTMHPLLQVESPDLKPLAAIVQGTPGLRLQLLGLKGPPPPALLQSGEICMEISMIEGVEGIGRLIERVALGRVLFGSHAPLFYFDSALLKLQESPLTEDQLRAIRCANAQRWLAPPIQESP